MRQPNFWQAKVKGGGGWKPELLNPFSVLYYIWFRLVQKKAQTKPAYKATIRVICVGNIVAGGAGKTPVALWLAEQLQAEGKKIAFLTRGYKRKAEGLLKVEAQHTAEDVGDEALLLARVAPTYVSANRAEAARMAEKEGADVLIMDDGFFHHSLHKDFSIAVFDGGFGIGNGYILPAGPLRETPKRALKNANALIVTGADEVEIETVLVESGVEYWQGFMKPVKDLDKDKIYYAFAGIGRPRKFTEMLVAHGANVKGLMSFPDHFTYDDKAIAALKHEAKQVDARLVTTEKDAVKLPSDFLKEVIVVKAKLDVRGGERLLKHLKSVLWP